MYFLIIFYYKIQTFNVILTKNFCLLLRIGGN